VKVTFGRRALRDLGDYLIHVALSHGSEAPAIRERVRIFAELQHVADLGLRGPKVRVEGWQRPLDSWYVHPFRVYYRRGQDGITIVRCYHHARRPIAQ
jgi:plasmid stabilization system protein ParE